MVDSTFTNQEGITLRFKGVLPPEDAPGSPERVAAWTPDDRVPFGYGFRTLRLWKEGDPRPGPQVSETHVVTEFVDLQFAGPYVPVEAALAMAEFADYTYFGIKERLGWDLEAPFPLVMPLDLAHYGSEMGLPWWVPGDVRDGQHRARAHLGDHLAGHGPAGAHALLRRVAAAPAHRGAHSLLVPLRRRGLLRRRRAASSRAR